MFEMVNAGVIAVAETRLEVKLDVSRICVIVKRVCNERTDGVE